MKIVHVLTYVSADGAYGGPVAVARMQTERLAARGHEVHLVAGWDGVARMEIPGVTVHLCRVRRAPGLGFAGLWSPGVTRTARRLARGADVVHCHLARDFVQLPAALSVLRRAPLVLQAHGMIRVDPRALARLVDAAATRRLYRRAAAHLFLTREESDDAPRIAGEDLDADRVVTIRNGVRLADRRAEWREAQAEVVFISRLQERKRPATFVEMAAAVVSEGGSSLFSIFGKDEGQAGAVQRAISAAGLEGRVRYRGALPPEGVVDQMAQSQVFVLPSVDEPFPMAVLEAMSTGLPCVITDQTGISEELRARGAALVTDGSPEQLAAAVRSVTESQETWQRLSDAATRAIDEVFSPSAVVDLLETVYARAGAVWATAHGARGA